MKTCNRKILELFYNANHSGRISKPDAIGRVGEDTDGLVIEITWRVVDGIIEDAKFRAFGNPNAIAITSLMTDYVIGKTVEDAMLIGEDVIVEALDEFRPEYMEAFDMVRAAMDEAYGNYLKRQSRGESIVTERVAEVEIEPVEQDSQYSVEDSLVEQIQTEIQVATITTSLTTEEKRGRGRPRKVVDPSEVVEVGEKRGRGRPRKERPEGEEIVVGEKRGRGRPRKIVDETAVVEVGEKRGRGRPRKERPEGEELVVGEKRGRGRPRKVVDPSEVVEVGEKRGRGRPRKERPEGEEIVIGEKRGRGRPRKIVDETAVVEVGEKRGRGRPKKEVIYNLPTDLNEVANDKDFDELIHGNSHQDNQEKQETTEFVDNLITNKLIDEDDDMFDADYDLFKSNIRSIFSGKEVDTSNHYGESRLVAGKTETIASIEQAEDEDDFESETNQLGEQSETIESNDILVEKRGRGRPRKVVDESEIIETEKRGRGRPRKELDETQEVEVGEKRGRGRPKKIVIETVESVSEPARRVDTVNSLTRSLSSPGGMPSFGGNQDIVFASKNVTTTNININVTKTTTSVDDNQSISNDYSKNVNYSSVQENSTISAPAEVLEQDDEIEVEPAVELSSSKRYDDFDDDFDDNADLEDEADDYVDDSHIKDEAPKGGIEDLLKALLDD